MSEAMAAPSLDQASPSKDRNAALRRIGWLDVQRLGAASVLVVGAGAIGNETLKNLALMGIGNISVFDRDTIEMSNLARSVLYRASDCGAQKAEVAARAVANLNPEIQVRWRRGDLETDLGEGFLRMFDVVLCCLDSVYARYVLNRRCQRAGVPWIDAGIETLDGVVQVFPPGEGACYECGFTDAHYEQAVGRSARSCGALALQAAASGSVPTTATIASVVAGIQVQECLKLLDTARWDGRSLAGRQFTYSGTNVDAMIIGLGNREDCPAHDFRIDWTEEPALTLEGASARMPVRDFLARVAQEFGGTYRLSMDHELVTGFSCPQCGVETRVLLPRERAFASSLTCKCGWSARWESDVAMVHHVGPNTPEHVLAAALIELGIPLGGIVEVQGPGRANKFVELSADVCRPDYWRNAGE